MGGSGEETRSLSQAEERMRKRTLRKNRLTSVTVRGLCLRSVREGKEPPLGEQRCDSVDRNRERLVQSEKPATASGDLIA